MPALVSSPPTTITCGLPAVSTNSTAAWLKKSYPPAEPEMVWLPVALYVVAGHRAEEWIAIAQRWVSAHQDPLTFYPSLVVGLVLVLDGILGFVTS